MKKLLIFFHFFLTSTHIYPNISIAIPMFDEVTEIKNLNCELGYEMNDAEIIQRLNLFINNDLNKMWIAKINGKAVGFITINIVEQFQSGKSIRIDSIIVNKDYRRKSIGTKLIQFVEAYAKKNGYKQIFLSSHVKRNEAHIFYQKLGYINNSKSFFKNIDAER